MRYRASDSTFYTRLCARYKLLYCIVLYCENAYTVLSAILLSNFCLLMLANSSPQLRLFSVKLSWLGVWLGDYK